MFMAKWCILVPAFLMIVAMLCPLVRADPIMPTRPLPQDANNNGITDSLDQEIADNIARGHGDDYVDVIVMLEYEPSTVELEAFTAAGGTVVAGPWKVTIYGFGGSIQYDKINTFAQNCQDLILVEKDGTCSISIPPPMFEPPMILPPIPSDFNFTNPPQILNSTYLLNGTSPFRPADRPVPEYSTTTLLFGMMGIALLVCCTTRIFKNKNTGHHAPSLWT